MNSHLTKTGLVPSFNNLEIYPIRRKTSTRRNIPLMTAVISKPVKFSVRPFGELYNPYSKSCSVFCNHPAPKEMRQTIRQMKDSRCSDVKGLWPDDINLRKNADLYDEQIPDDLYRRFTEIDSQPMTPTPTKTSICTRNSAGSFLNTRRCVTPEPGKDRTSRMKIILDLRRSHSQETIQWRAPSEISQSQTVEVSASNRSAKTVASSRKKPNETKSQPTSAEKTFRPKSAATVMQPSTPHEPELPPPVCINELDNEDDLSRRGKKRKKPKLPAGATFHLSQDPETQIAVIGPDSVCASTRPSLVPNVSSLVLNLSEKKTEQSRQCLKDSFLTEETFNILKTELDVDVLENSFGKYISRARYEAFRLTHQQPNQSTKKNFDYLLASVNITSPQKNMPRKFSKIGSRFDIPIDIDKLKTMKVFEYLSSNVWVSRQRKQLYKKTFLKFLKNDEEDGKEETGINQNTTRAIEIDNFYPALKDVLGFYGTSDVLNFIKDTVDLNGIENINFRSWCGIVSLAERYAINKYGDKDEPCEELEKIDFDTLERRLPSLGLSEQFITIFDTLREGHNAK